MYMYNATLFCDDCGALIIDDLRTEFAERFARATEFDCRASVPESVCKSFDAWYDVVIDGREWQVRLDRQGNLHFTRAVLDSGDSDQFPQYSDEDQSETDSPNHCDSGDKCINAVELKDGSKIGCLIRECLTAAGTGYVIQKHKEDPSEITGLWMEAFGLSLDDAIDLESIAPEEDEQAS